MWESLATTRRQDRVLHGAAKLFNVAAGLVALPAGSSAQRLSGPLRRMIERRGAAAAASCRSRRRASARWTRPDGRPRGDPEPASTPASWAELRKGLADMATFVLTQHHDLADFGYAYPSQFHDSPSRRRRRPDRGVGCAARGRAPRPDRRPRPLHDAPLRLRARDRGARVLRLGIQRRRRRPAQLRPHRADERGPLDRRLEGGRGHDRGRARLQRLGSTRVGALGSRSAPRRFSAPATPRAPTRRSTAGSSRSRRPPTSARRPSGSRARCRSATPPTRSTMAFGAMLTSRVRGSRWPDDIAAQRGARPGERRLLRARRGGDPGALLGREHIAGARVPVLVLHPEDDR